MPIPGLEFATFYIYYYNCIQVGKDFHIPTRLRINSSLATGRSFLILLAGGEVNK
jgi:hypothetical protein